MTGAGELIEIVRPQTPGPVPTPVRPSYALTAADLCVGVVIGEPKVKRYSSLPEAVRQRRLQRRRKKHQWVVDVPYTGQLITLLLNFGYFTEAQSRLDGRTYDDALSDAVTRFHADICNGKLKLTR